MRAWALILVVALAPYAAADVERCVDEACASTQTDDFGAPNCAMGRTAGHSRTATLSVPNAARNFAIVIHSSCSSSNTTEERNFVVVVESVTVEWVSEDRTTPDESHACEMRVGGSPVGGCPLGKPLLIPRLP